MKIMTKFFLLCIVYILRKGSSPIELVWEELDIKLKNCSPTSSEQLWQLLDSEWNKLYEDYFKKLINRISKIGAEIITAKKYWRFLYILPCVLVHYFCETLYLKSMFKNQVQISKLSWTLPAYIILVQGFIKAAIIYPKKAEIESILKDLGNIWRTDNKLTQNQIEKKESRLRKLNFYLAVFYWGSMIATYQCFMTSIGNVLFKKFVLDQEADLDFVFGNAYPSVVTKNWFLYLIVYFLQCFSVLQFVYVYLGAECLMIVLCALLSIAFALLREDLKSVVLSKTGANNAADNASMAIEDFVRNHQKLINLVELLNVIFNRLVCSDFFFATVIICFFSFGASVSQETIEVMKNMSAVAALMMPIYIVCYYAEQLQQESTGIMNSAYEVLWYRGNKDFQKSVSLIILRSQKPCCLTSLNYSPISLNSFTKVVSTTYSYYSLVRTMYEN